MTGNVQHDAKRQRFFVTVDGEEAYVQYARLDDDRVDFRSTFTPDALRGRGLAAVVVGEALAWARAEGLEVIPSCWYVKKYLDKESAR
ncbi:MAG: N-acetyltransferase [Gemmatimonadota bacterium]|nr:MAG: N-acetyltransferase [Gemmatimonadota bacterium]